MVFWWLWLYKYNYDSSFDGLKGFVTNDFSLNPTQIIEQYTNLWHIDRAFRISKTDLKLRPIYTEFSIGFKTIKATYEKTKDGYIRNILEVKLYEVSIVTIARNDKSKITDIKSLQLVDSIINEIIEETKSEKIHNKLLQLKSLLQGEPDDEPLEDPKPTDKKTVDVFEFNFK